MVQTFPPSDEPHRAEARQPSVRRPMPPRKKVMVVDDDQDILHSTEMLLNLLGYDAVPLAQAAYTVKVAENEHPDLILQDLKMQGLDVPRIVQELRRNPGTSKIPLVLFSASENVANAAAELDTAGYLAKPFDGEQLTRLLDNVLGENRPGSPPAAKDGDPILQQNVTALFHDHLNALAALNTYARIALKSPRINDQQEAIRNIQRLVARLEERVEQLRRQILALAGTH